MSRRSYYSSYGRYSQARSGPNVLPYFIIAALAALIWAYLHFMQQPVQVTVNGRAVDAYTGQAIPGAVVEVREQSGPIDPNAVANSGGQENGAVIVPSAGITVAGAQTSTLALVPSPAPVLTTTTAANGAFALQNLPQNAWLRLAPPGYAPQDVQVADRTMIEIAMVPNTLHGKVLTPDGKPVPHAAIYNGTAGTSSDNDGAFALDNVTDHNLVVKAPGYKSAKLQFGNVTAQDVQLTPFAAKTIYVNADSVASPGKFYDLIKIADDTEVNAMVIDVKADTTGFVLYDSKLPEVQAIGSANPVIPDLKAVVDTLHEHGIYVIARQALFWDERLVMARPDLSLHSKSTGQPWEDAYGHHWANPRQQEVWAYNIAIAKEVASLGVDEIQFDYVRFPSDGNLDDIDFGQTDGATRAQAIGAFLKRAYDELSPTGVYIAADVFGLSPIVDYDLGIGQQWEEIAAQVDYICPMAYPSHYADGFLGFDKPAEHPSEVVSYTIEEGEAKLLGRRAQIRPWLQDFTLYGITYEATRVRGQIEAAEKLNTSGWMLWNFDNNYTVDALNKQ